MRILNYRIQDARNYLAVSCSHPYEHQALRRPTWRNQGAHLY